MNFKLKVMKKLVLQNLINLREQTILFGVKSIESVDIFRFDSEEIAKVVYDIK